MKQNKLFAFAACAAIFAAASCTPEDPAPDMDVTGVTVSAPAFGGELTLSFTAQAAWTAESTAEWAVLDQTEGEAGDVVLKLAVAANDTFETREASVTVVSDLKSVTWTVSQDYVRVFGAASEITISAEKQSFAVSVTTNEEYTVNIDGEWLTNVTSKAAPKVSVVTLQATANTSITPRTATVTLTSASGSVETFTVNQEVSESVMVPVAVKYISNQDFIYDDNAYSNTTFQEYVFEFETKNGTVVFALNTAGIENPLVTIPEGEFETDASDMHEANTVSLAGKAGSTYFTKGESKIDVTDALVTIKSEGDNYVVSASLVDATETINIFVFEGTLPEVEDCSKGSDIYLSYYGNYATYFASGAESFSMTAYNSWEPADKHQLYYVAAELYAPKGNGSEKVTGTFTVLNDYETIEFDSQNGIDNIPAYSLYEFLAYEIYGYDEYESPVYCYWTAESGTLTVVENPDGTFTYNYDLKLAGKVTDYDSDYNEITVWEGKCDYKKSYTYPAIDVTSNAPSVIPDGDIVVSSYMSTQCLYFGKQYADVVGGEGLNVNTVSFTYVNSNLNPITIAFVDDGSWVFEDNGAKAGYCVNPLVPGVYTFGDGKAPHAFAIGNFKLATYNSSIKNSYTGHTYKVVGGSVTVTANQDCIFDLDCVYGETPIKVTGTLPIALGAGFRNRATASYARYVAWAE